MKLQLAALYLIFSFANATDFYITNPYSAISWKSGEKVRITWDLIQGGPNINSINVDLMDGGDSSAYVVKNVASGLDPNSRSVDWTVPADFPANNRIFVRVSGQGPAPSDYVYRFSHRFLVANPNPNAAEKPKAASQASEVIHSVMSKGVYSAAAAAAATATTESLPTTTSQQESTTSETEEQTKTKTADEDKDNSTSHVSSKFAARNEARSVMSNWLMTTIVVLLSAIMYHSL